jgi:hypothetical protein
MVSMIPMIPVSSIPIPIVIAATATNKLNIVHRGHAGNLDRRGQGGRDDPHQGHQRGSMELHLGTEFNSASSDCNRWYGQHNAASEV